MTFPDWFQILLFVAVATATATPLGRYAASVFEGRVRLLAPVEAGFYRLAGVDPAREQGWLGYTFAVLAFNAAGFAALYLILRLQGVLPVNPQDFGAVDADLAFNTAVSFTTNTNWQAYGGETTLTHLTQMMGLTTQNFVSAATGIAVAIAVTRAFARSSARTLGNFWVDLTRCTLYLLLPMAIVVALALVALGVPQTLEGSFVAQTVEGAEQVVSVGPAASQVAIKQLGTNGGGFFNVNSAHPLENPSYWTNALQLWAIVAIPLALAVTFGRMTARDRDGYVLLSVMAGALLAFAGLAYWAESAGNPIVQALGVAGGNMEGKEVRFGEALSTLWATFTTGASNGSVNSMHDSFTPLGGLVPLFLMQLGEILPGGVGSGLYGMIVFAILAVFVAGLMVGRTPEYLGKKIEAKDVKMAMLAVLVMPLFILGFTAVSAVMPATLASIQDAGPHGLSEIMYAYTSGAGNNGSAFAGFGSDTTWYNTTIGLSMLFGRFAIIVPVMMIAGSLVAKPRLAPSQGTFPTDTALFAGLLAGVILIFGGLQFFPALALGPVVEHVMMLDGTLF
ncbi:potassium-transporting ATPase subunit KdpA [Salinarimonas ramus]|uniref:Potassium-transporting ATPase potassium-binding subunit n=1 Tax=Salinarimonas ramus TaxID=690164 RepID=A0A917V6X5_9HYPH|nr:potassium-transporting ATPase subunit KdpA [Salinarimonas ramus]GGK44978.1 potassium-transporting ATPase potassium-binding subunit [Salinarimonas ramus]